jgi:hypothetical protein
MDSLRWTASGSGWSCNQYRIELAAPKLFALIDLTTRHESLVQFSPSVAWLKHVARRSERSRVRRATAFWHWRRVAAGVLAVQLSINFSPILIFPTALFAAVVTLRALVWWMDSVHGSPWNRISETYQ